VLSFTLPSLRAPPPPPTPRQALLGEDASEALGDLQRLWALAAGYGYQDWLVFDASVVRGLAYYTGGAWAYYAQPAIEPFISWGFIFSFIA
jgi:ATP phosphoribosyltransferase regulatory subunit HisZ